MDVPFSAGAVGLVMVIYSLLRDVTVTVKVDLAFLFVFACLAL